jgi:hypothetical protein
MVDKTKKDKDKKPEAKDEKPKPEATEEELQTQEVEAEIPSETAPTEAKAFNPLEAFTQKLKETDLELIHFDESHREFFRFERFFTGSGIWASIFVIRSSMGKLLRLTTFTEWIGVPEAEDSKVSIARGVMSIAAVTAESGREDVLAAAKAIDLDLEKTLQFSQAMKERNLQGQEARAHRAQQRSGTPAGSSPEVSIGGPGGKVPF